MSDVETPSSRGLIFFGYAIAIVGGILSHSIILEWAMSKPFSSEGKDDLAFGCSLLLGWIPGASLGMFISRAGGGDKHATIAAEIAGIGLLCSWVLGVYPTL
jgi:hypothetical protein